MHYKAPDNSVHYIEPEFAHFLPVGSVQITDKEAEALRVASLPIVDPKDAIRAEIVQLETAQLMPRVTREFMLLFMEANGGTIVPGYAPLKAFDDQVKALRAQL